LDEPYTQFRLNKQLVGESKKLKISVMNLELFNLIGSRKLFQRPDKILYISVLYLNRRIVDPGYLARVKKKRLGSRFVDPDLEQRIK
jgi:hypothetical protein